MSAMCMVNWLVMIDLRRQCSEEIHHCFSASLHEVAARKAAGECFEEQHGTTKESVVSGEGQRIAVLGEPDLRASLLAQ